MTNLETSLSTLAEEINALSAQSKSAQVSMGQKLLQIRALLCEQNGEKTTGKPGIDGRRPIGWYDWIRRHLTISPDHATHCIIIAVDPDKQLRNHADREAKRRRGAVFLKSQIRNIWPLLSEDERNGCIDLMVSLQEGQCLP